MFGRSPELARRDQGLGGLDRVPRVQANMVAGLHPDPGQVVGQPVRAFLELAIGHLPVTAGQRQAIREGVHSMLEEIGNVQGHGNESRTCYRFGQPSAVPNMRRYCRDDLDARYRRQRRAAPRPD
jgi:hypothetical protein